MFQKQIPLPVKFICGFVYSDERVYQQAKKALEKKFGRADFESEKIKFDFTTYYQQEMGTNLSRRFLSFYRLQKVSRFAKIKLFCLKLEKKYAQTEKRIVNIDPGYLNQAKLVLTSSKDFSHRIHLSSGVYAEITLIFSKGEFRELKTTFPDYRTPTYKNIFQSIRDIYSRNLKNEA